VSETVIAIWLGAGGAAHARAMLLAVRSAHPAARLILLTTPDGWKAAGDLASFGWEDGALRGASAFLARARRLSWASPDHIYDLEVSPMTKLLSKCVWPRPQWHQRAPSGGAPGAVPPVS
jgi:hypothetical protein